MIHIACKDYLQPEATGGVLNFHDELLYVTSSFGLTPEQIHDTPPSGLPIILLQPIDGTHVQGENSLVGFVHPDDCVYLFGATHGQLTLDYPVDDKIYIPNTPTWSMFASQAVAVVLYDRFVKRGSFG